MFIIITLGNALTHLTQRLKYQLVPWLWAFGGILHLCCIMHGDVSEVITKNFVESLEQPEFTEEIYPYIKALYISGTERNIIIYKRVE